MIAELVTSILARVTGRFTSIQWNSNNRKVENHVHIHVSGGVFTCGESTAVIGSNVEPNRELLEPPSESDEESPA